MTKSNNNLVLRVRKDRRAGLTLVELLVVLTIIVAVAGIGVSILPNFQKRTHGSTSAVSLRDAESVITRNLANGGTIGNAFDGLVSATPAFPDYVGNSGAAGDTFAVTTAPDQGLVDALAAIGITDYYQIAADADSLTDFIDNGGENVTFESHDYSAPVAIGTGTPLASLTAGGITQVEESFNIPTGQFDQIVVFGLGQRSSIVGVNGSFKEAPVHFPAEGTAANKYARYAVLVGYAGTATTGEATYIGVTCIDDGEKLNNIQGNLGEYFEAL